MMREKPEQGQGGCCKENGQDELTVRAEVAQHCHPAFQKGQHKHWPAGREEEVFHKDVLVEALLCLFGGEIAPT